jgi:hypothetical protein
MATHSILTAERIAELARLELITTALTALHAARDFNLAAWQKATTAAQSDTHGDIDDGLSIAATKLYVEGTTLLTNSNEAIEAAKTIQTRIKRTTEVLAKIEKVREGLAVIGALLNVVGVFLNPATLPTLPEKLVTLGKALDVASA